MKYYLARIGADSVHRVVGEIDLTKSTLLVIGEVLPSGESQYIFPEVLLPKVNDLGITTTVQDFDNVFAFEKMPDLVDVETGLDEITEKVK